MQTNLFFLIGALAVAGCASSQAAREPATARPAQSNAIEAPRIQVTVTTAPRYRMTRPAAKECVAE